MALAEVKTKNQIERENKLKESKEILEKLGFKGLSIGDFVDSNTTEHSSTKVEFFKKDESELKKIQFKDLGGGADQIDDLYGFSIKVYLEWDRDESKFPKNMKFSFENQYFSPFEFKKRGKNSVKILKKDSNNRKNTIFKIENQGGGKWYLVKTNN